MDPKYHIDNQQYFLGNKSIDFTVFDLKNKLLFDIENGESDIEYRIMWFN